MFRGTGRNGHVGVLVDVVRITILDIIVILDDSVMRMGDRVASLFHVLDHGVTRARPRERARTGRGRRQDRR